MSDVARCFLLFPKLAQNSPPRCVSYALYSGSKFAPLLFVEVLAKELGSRGVTVNAILPTVTSGAGLSTDGVRPQVRDFVHAFNPMQRAGTVGDVAAAEYLAGELSGDVSGQHLKVSGGAPAWSATEVEGTNFHFVGAFRKHRD